MRNVDEIMIGRPVEEEDYTTRGVLIGGRSVPLSSEVYGLGYIGAIWEHYEDGMSCMYER